MRLDHAEDLEALAAHYRRNPLEVREYHAERSAIRQYEGGMSVEYADVEALRDTREWLAASASAAPQTQRVSTCTPGAFEVVP